MTARIAIEESVALRDAIAEAVASLGERDRWVFEAVVYRGSSFRALGRELNLAKSYVHRLYQAACDDLAFALVDHPAVVDHINRNHSLEGTP